MSSQQAVERLPLSLPSRIRMALGRGSWLQLTRFCLVGVSGYAINLAVFTAATQVAGYRHLAAAALAFVAAFTSNFWWNRVWTFHARHVRKRRQALRFLGVSVAAFVVAAGVLHALVTTGSVPVVGAQAASIVVATPVNFVGAKLWSFRDDRGRM
jgi:putative flippase GtrA